MKKTLRISALTCCIAATAVLGAQNLSETSSDATSLRKIVCTYTLGHLMEGGSDDEVSKKEVNYYGLDNNLDYTAYYGLNADKSFSLTKLVKYNTYERNDSIFHDASYYQWGLYNFGDPSMKASSPSGTVSQAYSKDGKLLRDEQASYTYNYEYDSEGRLEKMTKSLTSSGSISEICTYQYSDGKMTGETATDSKGVFKYRNVFEYDESGNKVSAGQWKRKTASDENTEYLSQREEWKYTDGTLTEYIKYTGGKAPASEGAEATEPSPNTRKTYEVYKGNNDQILMTSYTYSKSSQSWNLSGNPTVTEYADFESSDMATLLYGTELNVQADKSTYTTSVTFDAPRISMSKPSKITLFRDGHIVKTVTVAGSVPEELDPSTGKFTIVDNDVLAGHHDYFVQTSVGHGDELATVDDYTWTPGNITNIASVDVDYGFSPVTDLRMTDSKKETVKNDNDGTTNIERTAIISYTNPEIDDNSGFVKNELYRYVNSYNMQSYTLLDWTDDATKTSMEASYPNASDAIDVLVVSHYKYGTVKSELLHITKDQLDALATSIANANAGEGMEVKVDNGVVSINGKANIRILSLDGKLLNSVKNASSISTDNLSGAYIISVEKDGKIVKTLKSAK